MVVDDNAIVVAALVHWQCGRPGACNALVVRKVAEVDGSPRAHGITLKDGITLEDGRERRRPGRVPGAVHATAITPAG